MTAADARASLSVGSTGARVQLTEVGIGRRGHHSGAARQGIRRAGALWRTTADGTTYVVALRKGSLERYWVDEDGTATLVDSTSRRFGRRWLVALFVVGGLLFAGGGIASESHPELTPLVVVGWLLWVAGIVIGGLGQDLARRAHRAYRGKGQWHAPTDLRQWAPRSTAQLAAVERIADEHVGVAYVRDVGARTVDVLRGQGPDRALLGRRARRRRGSQGH